jgi:hypothetical protein
MDYYPLVTKVPKEVSTYSKAWRKNRIVNGNNTENDLSNEKQTRKDSSRFNEG